jgi:hypothetical protein
LKHNGMSSTIKVLYIYAVERKWNFCSETFMGAKEGWRFIRG